MEPFTTDDLQQLRVALRREYLFVPVVRFFGRRYRTRLRWLSTWAVGSVVDVHPRGLVYRLWCGRVLVVCMVDRV